MHAYIALCLATGIRTEEARALRWEHVDFAQSVVHVLENVTRGRRSSPKGKRRRSVPLALLAPIVIRELRDVLYAMMKPLNTKNRSTPKAPW